MAGRAVPKPDDALPLSLQLFLRMYGASHTTGETVACDRAMDPAHILV